MIISALRTVSNRILISFMVMVQVLFFPGAALADEVAPTDTPTDTNTSEQQPADPAPADSQQSLQTGPTEPVGPQEPTGPQDPTGPTDPVGPQEPTGSDSSTYTFNPDTGLWENDYYTWDPATGQTSPKTPQSYSYNPTTGMWDTTEWYYSPETGKYEPNVVSTPVNPYAALLGGANDPSITNTGPNSNNTIDVGGNNNGTFDLFFNASISNKIGQMTRSGNATVQGNTWGGDAATGDALALLNLLNMLQATWGNLGSDDIGLFVANVDGDVTGDLYVDPGQLAQANGNTNIDVNISSDASINNDIDVDTASGNATVANNTTGGNATTGDARAIVNLLNLINSAIRANRSFIGILNINGNLNGDILLPPDLLQAIIAATGPSSNNQINTNNNSSLDVTIDDTKTINNDVTTDASSGNALVGNNTSGGNATTGNANSNIVLLNLTGQRVVARNALLVFVNVLGSWVGLIFNAPPGTNAIAATGPGSNNTINADSNLNADIDVTKHSEIDNDINVAAHSGDASVTGNTSGGNATTGDADIGVNVLNMIDSQFDLSDWFGVLFINVFGSWVGSFGVNTDAGNAPIVSPAVATTGVPTAPGNTFTFVPRTASISNTGSNSNNAISGTTSQSGGGPTVEAAVASVPQTSQPKGSTSSTDTSNGLMVSGVVFFTGLLLLGGERMIVLIRTRQQLA